MERIRHIRETSHTNTEEFENDPVRPEINRLTEYDPATENRREQIEVRKYLDSFDEDQLREIFAEYFRKSGADESSMVWTPLSDVRILYKSPEEEELSASMSGGYSLADGIMLYSNLIWDDSDAVLWTLIHEQCHSVSKDKLRYYDISDDEGHMIGERERIKSGVSSTVWTRVNSNDNEIKSTFFKGFNEGITELLTERIFKEYKKRTGTEQYIDYPLSQKRIKGSERVASAEKFDSYEREWKNIRLYIGIIAAITDTPKDVVEDSVIRTYLRNGNIFPEHEPGVGELLENIHPKLGIVLLNIIDSNKEDNPSLRAYVDHIIRQDIPNDLKDKIIHALNEVKEEWGEAYKLAPYEV